ncbi:MAG: alpha/beta hydrolase [Candidatus Lokiarchaeota archaeon]|nr:alpha/beta hydrolase [Candidatus Lokiarchaeota archaeon]
MKFLTLRTYNIKPYKVALLHGGPGAPGYMGPFAQELSKFCGVLEPFQTKKSIKGQVRELKKVIKKYGKPPLTLIGHSWGAFLGYILSAQYPALVKKLILIGSPPFEEKYAKNIMETRMNRMGDLEKHKVNSIIELINSTLNTQNNSLLRQMGDIFHKTDNYLPLTDKSEVIEYQLDIYKNIWKQASLMRQKKEILQIGSKIKCPVVCIHGDYDPHPYEGVYDPLASILSDFKFVLLERCGHNPWIEEGAKDFFYKIIKEELDIIGKIYS